MKWYGMDIEVWGTQSMYGHRSFAEALRAGLEKSCGLCRGGDAEDVPGPPGGDQPVITSHHRFNWGPPVANHGMSTANDGVSNGMICGYVLCASGGVKLEVDWPVEFVGSLVNHEIPGWTTKIRQVTASGHQFASLGTRNYQHLLTVNPLGRKCCGFLDRPLSLTITYSWWNIITMTKHLIVGHDPLIINDDKIRSLIIIIYYNL